MAVYTQTPTWPPVTLTDTEQVIDFIRQQAKRELAQEMEQRVVEGGVKNIRHRLGQLIEDAEVLDAFPDHAIKLLELVQNILWESQE